MLSLNINGCGTSNLEFKDTINLKSSSSAALQENFVNTPIQYACIHGNINIIKYLYDYFIKAVPPYIFDINYQNEDTGENCPLITCRHGLYKVMRFLYEECSGNFYVKNRNDENAILILANASKNQDNYDYYLCMRYLLEIIKIDPTYMYEKVVLMISNYELLELYYKALVNFDIFPDTLQLERLNQIRNMKESFNVNIEDLASFNALGDSLSYISSINNSRYSIKPSNGETDKVLDLSSNSVNN